MRTYLSEIISLAIASKGPIAPFVLAVNLFLERIDTKLRIRRFPQCRVAVGEFVFYVDTWDGLLTIRRRHERMVAAALSEFVASKSSPGGLMVNVGAHIGSHFIRFAGHFFRSIAFEPTPRTFILLQKNVAANGLSASTDLRQECAGAENCTTRLFVGSRESQNSLRRNRNAEALHPLAIEVRVTTLDTMIPESDRQSVELILIDVEGAELDVLHGAVGILTKSNAQIIIELLNDDAQVACSEFLSTYGYRGTALDDTNWRFVKI
jgi:FkbM family methyltransferase